GSGQTTRDFAWIEGHIRDGEHACLVDVTSAYSILSLMGPRAEALLARLSSDDLSQAGMPFAASRLVDVGHARPRATRMSYVGGPGYELCVPTDQCVTLYDALCNEGAPFGLRDAGLGYAVALDKPDFIGRDALLRQRERGLSKRLVQFVLDDPAAFAWGGEPVLMDGRPVG